jgi:hypothetical protein
MRERRARDRLDHRAVGARRVGRVVAGARVDDDDLHLGVDALRAHRREQLAEQGPAVEHGYGDAHALRHGGGRF